MIQLVILHSKSTTSCDTRESNHLIRKYICKDLAELSKFLRKNRINIIGINSIRSNAIGNRGWKRRIDGGLTKDR